MNTRIRTVAELEKKRDETKSRLLSLESLIGHQLFTTADANVENTADYQRMCDEKDYFLNLITEIQQLSSERGEIKSRAEEIKKKRTELGSHWDEVLEIFGTELYEYPTDSLVNLGSSSFADIQNEKKALAELEKQAAAIKTEMETQNLFNRLVTQVKLVTVSNTAALHRRKITKLLIKLAQDAFNSPQSAKERAAGTLAQSVLIAFEKCQTLQQEIDAQEKRLHSLHDADMVALERLAALFADNPQKRIAELRSEFHKKEDELEELCGKTGHEFTNLYVTPDGEELLPYSGAMSTFLSDVAAERTKLRSYNRRIEIVQIAGAIEETDKKIALFKHTFAENNRKAELLKGHNEELTQKIATVAELKENLQFRLSELESIEAPTTKLLNKPEK